MKIWPRSLTTQLLLLLMVVLVVSQLIILTIFHFDRQDLIYSARWQSLSQRINSIVDVFSVLPGEEYNTFVNAVSSPDIQVRFISEENIFAADIIPGGDRSAEMLFRSIKEQLGGEYSIRVKRVLDQNQPTPEWIAEMGEMHSRHHGSNRWNMGRMGRLQDQFIVQLQLNNGRWLEFYSSTTELPLEQWPLKLMLSTLVIIFSAWLLVILLIRLLVKPLQDLGTAADAFGRNIETVAIKETGPDEIRRTAHAFNTMQERLKRYIADRSQILSAISHDLKTPVTRMRLRSEMLEDQTVRDKFCSDLDEMTAMIDETLEFMRGEESNEEVVSVDFNSFIEAIQADREEQGQNFVIKGKSEIPIVIRLRSIKRCLNNLLDNAFRYGTEISVVLDDQSNQLIVQVTDNGPGIPEDQLERVFEPFNQLNRARTRHEGGSGLGLGIARNIVRGHGGDLTLCNSDGLVARITLPR